MARALVQALPLLLPAAVRERARAGIRGASGGAALCDHAGAGPGELRLQARAHGGLALPLRARGAGLPEA